jgi:hypothetical protein
MFTLKAIERRKMQAYCVKCGAKREIMGWTQWFRQE